MPEMTTVLVYSAAAALTAGAGVLPLPARGQASAAWLGWSNAIAAGLMLGAAYVLLAAGDALETMALAAGAGLGIGFTYAAHAVSGTHDLELTSLSNGSADYARKVVWVHILHAAPEGVTIGVAMILSPELGAAMTLAIAAHNIPESALLGAVLMSQGASRQRAAALATGSRSGQVLLAAGTYLGLGAWPAAVPWAVGFAVAGLIYLVMAELLPECYRHTGATSVAVVIMIAMGLVVVLAGWLS
ncbi:MAG TPA: hypothetical protein VD793_02440 [Gemmatimonadales bacterium]|nr:hypothetical protein [Gemmatimonadales bacterium]